MRPDQDDGERAGQAPRHDSGSFGHQRPPDRWRGNATPGDGAPPPGAHHGETHHPQRGGGLGGVDPAPLSEGEPPPAVGPDLLQPSTPTPAPAETGTAGDAIDVLRTVGYLRVWDTHGGADGWHAERDAAASALARFAAAQGLRLLRVHEDTPITGARRPGLAAVIRAVITGAAFTVLLPDALHLSTDADVHSALTGLLTDVGAQVIYVRNDAPDTARRGGAE